MISITPLSSLKTSLSASSQRFLEPAHSPPKSQKLNCHKSVMRSDLVQRRTALSAALVSEFKEENQHLNLQLPADLEKYIELLKKTLLNGITPEKEIDEFAQRVDDELDPEECHELLKLQEKMLKNNEASTAKLERLSQILAEHNYEDLKVPPREQIE